MATLTVNEKRGKRSNWMMVALVVVLLAAVAVVALAANGALAGILGTEEPGEAAVADWQAQDLDSYRYTLQVGCFCIEEMRRPVIIEVRDGVLAGITYADDGSEADPTLFERYTSVEALFGVIEEAAAEEPARLDVVYDQTTGVPQSITIDISEQMADEELYLAVSNFEAIE